MIKQFKKLWCTKRHVFEWRMEYQYDYGDEVVEKMYCPVCGREWIEYFKPTMRKT